MERVLSLVWNFLIPKMCKRKYPTKRKIVDGNAFMQSYSINLIGLDLWFELIWSEHITVSFFSILHTHSYHRILPCTSTLHLILTKPMAIDPHISDKTSILISPIRRLDHPTNHRCHMEIFNCEIQQFSRYWIIHDMDQSKYHKKNCNDSVAPMSTMTKGSWLTFTPQISVQPMFVFKVTVRF